jgi:hypothetical protein
VIKSPGDSPLRLISFEAVHPDAGPVLDNFLKASTPKSSKIMKV